MDNKMTELVTSTCR